MWLYRYQSTRDSGKEPQDQQNTSKLETLSRPQGGRGGGVKGGGEKADMEI